jgi:hypothetical protein
MDNLYQEFIKLSRFKRTISTSIRNKCVNYIYSTAGRCNVLLT